MGLTAGLVPPRVSGEVKTGLLALIEHATGRGWSARAAAVQGDRYTARWVDRLLFPTNGPSADRIIPELQNIDVGMFTPTAHPKTSAVCSSSKTGHW